MHARVACTVTKKMTQNELAFRATTEETCAWLTQQTGSVWTLARLIESGLIPYVWLDYSADYPELFGDATGGYPAPIFYEADTKRLAAGSEDVLITFTKDADKIAIQLAPPGIRAPLASLRFLQKDIAGLANKLASDLKKASEPVKLEPATAKESQKGISKEQVLLAFASIVKIDLEKALTTATGIFGDEGSKVKSGPRVAKNKALWNPVTLALGLNDVYRVPMPHLKRAFTAHPFLREWADQWQKSLDLLGL
jgi:hypothetical protein